MTTQDGCPLFCSLCGKVMAYMDYGEFTYFEEGDGQDGLCFDCDPDSASTVPALFWQWKPGDLFTIGDDVFCVTDTQPQQLVNVGFSSHAHVRMCAPGLSSSTYLHKTHPNKGREVESSVNDAKCSKCGSNEFWEGVIYLECKTCGKLTEKKDFITIPTWIIEPKGESPSKMDVTADCPDCEASRLRGDSGYCDYHYVLLMESFEDRLIGWGNE